MINYDTYDIHMIVMSEHPISQMYSRITIPSWEKLNYKVNLFEAVTPKDLYKKTKLDFAMKKSKGGVRPFTETEKAVWYSHFELWCLCATKRNPIVIIEHDSLLKKELPDFKGHGYKLLSYMDRDFRPKGKAIAAGSGYYITPELAFRLIANAVSTEIDQNSDGFIGSICNIVKQHKMRDFYYIEQINIDGLNTIDHKNPHRNYVGLDYEEIDIPSLHGQKI